MMSIAVVVVAAGGHGSSGLLLTEAALSQYGSKRLDVKGRVRLHLASQGKVVARG